MNGSKMVATGRWFLFLESAQHPEGEYRGSTRELAVALGHQGLPGWRVEPEYVREGEQ